MQSRQVTLKIENLLQETSLILAITQLPGVPQFTILQPSTKGKYRIFASIVTEVCWLHMLFQGFGWFFLSPQSDSLVSQCFCIGHARTKHIEIEYHFVHEKVCWRDL